ncbi:MAG: hypothetical protein KA438_05500 [Aliarcobacter sp.]|jgi:hypothetical protein|nr:hypothetical protein [Aliarcobacter sp.]MBP6713103.1 hypothetical protein [Aliarcobacter sp.]MBP7226869.1 hypothetical protein [Aliarcobacter sp.]MDX9960481.1 hypothetical protein [Aliarcobacter sp.]
MLTNILKSIFKKITKLSRPYFSFEDNELKFKIDSDNFYLFPISNIETKTRHNSYVLETYTLKTDDLYIEYIHTETSVTWNGQAFSFFLNLIKQDLKIKDMKLLEKKEFSHYEFLTYEINDDYILNFIYIYEISKEIFIIDFKGELYENLLRNFQKDYKYKYEKKEHHLVDLNTSLVKNNAIYDYFRMSGS